MTIHIVGCGGVASYAVPVLAKVCQYHPEFNGARGMGRGKATLVLQDRDRLEERNLERQLFSNKDVGESKASALARSLRPFKPIVVDQWFTSGFVPTGPTLFFCFADNHVARKAVLDAVDYGNAANPSWQLTAIIAGNGERNADAYLYRSEWKNTLADPRERYPEIRTDRSDDPTHACNSEETLVSTGGQTATANFQAAQYALQLFQAHFLIEGIPDAARESLPAEIRGNFSKVFVKTVKQLREGE